MLIRLIILTLMMAILLLLVKGDVSIVSVVLIRWLGSESPKFVNRTGQE